MQPMWRRIWTRVPGLGVRDGSGPQFEMYYGLAGQAMSSGRFGSPSEEVNLLRNGDAVRRPSAKAARGGSVTSELFV